MIPAESKELVRLSASAATEMLAALDDFEIVSDDTACVIVDTAAEARRRTRVAEEERAKITRPLDAAKAAVRELFAPPIAAWGAIEARCKGMLAEYRSACEREREAAAAALAAAVEGEAIDEAVTVETLTTLPAIPGAPSMSTAAASSYSVSRWEAEVEDLAALVRAVADGKAPLELVRPDISALRIYARKTHDQNVPGVRFTEIKEERIRSK